MHLVGCTVRLVGCTVQAPDVGFKLRKPAGEDLRPYAVREVLSQLWALRRSSTRDESVDPRYRSDLHTALGVPFCV